MHHPVQDMNDPVVPLVVPVAAGLQEGNAPKTPTFTGLISQNERRKGSYPFIEGVTRGSAVVVPLVVPVAGRQEGNAPTSIYSAGVFQNMRRKHTSSLSTASRSSAVPLVAPVAGLQEDNTPATSTHHTAWVSQTRESLSRGIETTSRGKKRVSISPLERDNKIAYLEGGSLILRKSNPSLIKQVNGLNSKSNQPTEQSTEFSDLKRKRTDTLPTELSQCKKAVKVEPSVASLPAVYPSNKSLSLLHRKAKTPKRIGRPSISYEEHMGLLPSSSDKLGDTTGLPDVSPSIEESQTETETVSSDAEKEKKDESVNARGSLVPSLLLPNGRVNFLSGRFANLPKRSVMERGLYQGLYQGLGSTATTSAPTHKRLATREPPKPQKKQKIGSWDAWLAELIKNQERQREAQEYTTPPLAFTIDDHSLRLDFDALRAKVRKPYVSSSADLMPRLRMLLGGGGKLSRSAVSKASLNNVKTRVELPTVAIRADVGDLSSSHDHDDSNSSHYNSDTSDHESSRDYSRDNSSHDSTHDSKHEFNHETSHDSTYNSDHESSHDNHMSSHDNLCYDVGTGNDDIKTGVVSSVDCDGSDLNDPSSDDLSHADPVKESSISEVELDSSHHDNSHDDPSHTGTASLSDPTPSYSDPSHNDSSYNDEVAEIAPSTAAPQPKSRKAKRAAKKRIQLRQKQSVVAITDDGDDNDVDADDDGPITGANSNPYTFGDESDEEEAIQWKPIKKNRHGKKSAKNGARAK